MKSGRYQNHNSPAATKKGRETRQRIYVASIKLINSRSYQSITIPEICRESGISVGSFYHHFSSKKDLLAGYVREESGRLMDFYINLDKESSIEELFLTIHEFFSYFGVKGADFVSAFLSIILTSHGVFFQPREFALYPIISDALSRAAAAGELNPAIQTDMIKDLLTGSIWQLMIEWCTAENPGDLQQIAAARMASLRRLITAPADAPADIPTKKPTTQ